MINEKSKMRTRKTGNKETLVLTVTGLIAHLRACPDNTLVQVYGDNGGVSPITGIHYDVNMNNITLLTTRRTESSEGDSEGAVIEAEAETGEGMPERSEL